MKEQISITSIASISPLGASPELVWEAYLSDKHFLKSEPKKENVILGAISQENNAEITRLKNSDEKYKNLPSCKFDMLKDMIDEILSEDHKILIFSQFVKPLKIIENSLKLLSIKTTQISIQDLQVFEDFLYIYDRKNVHSFVVQKAKK